MKNGAWNGEYYVSFGDGGRRNWSDGQRLGFVAAGSAPWYYRSLTMLSEGDRIWVNVPGSGYVGVGTVTTAAVPITQFMVTVEGQTRPIAKSDVTAQNMFDCKDDPEKAEYLVGVDWIKTVGKDEAIREKGFFGNQNSACKPTAASWEHTVTRLKQRFGVD